MPIWASKQLKANRPEKPDQHELDEDYLKRSENTYLKIAKRFFFHSNYLFKIRYPKAIRLGIYRDNIQLKGNNLTSIGNAYKKYILISPIYDLFSLYKQKRPCRLQ